MKQIYIQIILVLIGLKSYAENPSLLCDSQRADSYIRYANSIQPRATETIEVMAWNTLKFKRQNAFSDLVNLTTTNDIVFIQESMHSSELQRAFASHISMDWTFYKSFCQDAGATGVQTGTRFKQLHVEAVTAPALEPVVNTPKVTGFSIVEIYNTKVLLVNVHGLNANTGKDFEAHMNQIYEKIKNFSGPVIWAGDFNTWNPARTNYLKNIAKKLRMEVLVPPMDVRKLKLDHIIVRGFKPVKIEILNTFASSDHWPVRAELEFVRASHSQ